MVLGVPLIVDAMAGERESRGVLADAEKARDIAQADPLRCVGAGAPYTANSSTWTYASDLSVEMNGGRLPLGPPGRRLVLGAR